MGDVRYPACGMCRTVATTSLDAMRSTCDGTARRTFGLQAALAAILLLAACSGTNAPRVAGAGSPSPSTAHSGVPFTQCMRRHGVPKYPDPNPQSPDLPGFVQSAHDVGVTNSQLQSAERACYHTLPYNDNTLTPRSLVQCEYLGDCPPSLVNQAMTELLAFARCMRTHGYPWWPDPVLSPRGAPHFKIGDKSPPSQEPAVCEAKDPDTGGEPLG